MRPETVLAFDTSAALCAAALLLPDGRVIERAEPMDKGQAERLLPLLAELLSEADITWGDVTRLAVGTGPGNFTGVRIAVAAARGLALGLGVPALGISRLEAQAHGLPRPLTVVLDARRGEVWHQRFDGAGPGAPGVSLPGALAVTGAVTGDAAGPTALPPAMGLARAMAEIAATRPLPQPRPAPLYLRGADAAPPADPPPVILP